VFDDYVRDRADKERQEKRAQFRKARDEFRNLLEESKITPRTSFNEFCLHHSKDERFKKIEKMRERENLFNDYITEIRKRDREKMTELRDQVCTHPFTLSSHFSFDSALSRGRISISYSWNSIRKIPLTGESNGRM
jgi:hypothetical protein